jgi:hypothetical protein
MGNSQTGEMVQSEKQAFLERWHDILAPNSLGYRIRLLSQLVRRKVAVSFGAFWRKLPDTNR